MIRYWKKLIGIGAISALSLALVACSGVGADAADDTLEEGLPNGGTEQLSSDLPDQKPSESTRLADGEPGAPDDPDWSDTDEGRLPLLPDEPISDYGNDGGPVQGGGSEPRILPDYEGREPADWGQSDGQVEPVEPQMPSYELVRVRAVIAEVNLVSADSMPPQYSVHIAVDLPSGCVEPGGYEMTRDGNDFVFDVVSLAPAEDDVICTMILGRANFHADLKDTVQGETYRIIVNGEVYEGFTAE